MGESEKFNCFGGVLLKPGKSSRRNFIIGGALAVGGMAVAAAYSFIEPQWIKVRKYTIPVQNLPGAFEGLNPVWNLSGG